MSNNKPLSKTDILALAEIHETGTDEMERHVFTDADLLELIAGVLSVSTKRLLTALDGMDRGCREPGFRGHENGLGESSAGDELQDAREELVALVGHVPAAEEEIR